MVSEPTPKRGAPWSSYADYMRGVEPLLVGLRQEAREHPANVGLDGLTDVQRRLVDWWLPYRRMDRWLADGMAVLHNTNRAWPGPSSVPVPARRRWWALYMFGWTCWYCECALTPEIVSPDHLTPTSHGGPDHIDNVRPACVSCNSRKGARTEAEYRSSLVAA